MPPTFDELLTQFRGLLDAYRADPNSARSGEGNLRCEHCFDCHRCRFCVHCVRCEDCSNCEQCQDCRNCTRTRASRYCAHCGHVEYCEGCEDSQYLVLCLDCIGCTQCFACVGLRGEEFCVLNQRYSRKDYFPVVQALKKKLEEAIAAGQVLPELALVRGIWPPRAGEALPLTGAGEPSESGEIDEGEDPWADGAAPDRTEVADTGEPAVDPATAPAVSWAPLPPRPDEV